MIRLARGCKRWHPLAPGRRYGTRRSPLSKDMSLHLFLNQQETVGPFRESNQMYIFFNKEMCLVRSLHWQRFFLLFECSLDFYNWFRVFLHNWIRKWHPFLSIRSGVFVRLIWKKNQILWQNRLHFCGIISWFLSTHIILNIFLREKMFCQQHIMINW